MPYVDSISLLERSGKQVRFVSLQTPFFINNDEQISDLKITISKNNREVILVMKEINDL